MEEDTCEIPQEEGGANRTMVRENVFISERHCKKPFDYCLDGLLRGGKNECRF